MAYVTKERAPLTSELVNEKLGRTVPLPPHQECHAYAQQVIEHAAQMEEGWEREAADVDKLLRGLGLDPDSCRSEGGLLLVGKVVGLIQRRERELGGVVLAFVEQCAKLEGFPEIVSPFSGVIVAAKSALGNVNERGD